MSSLPVEPRDLVEAGLYRSEDEAIQAALSELLEHHPDLRIAIAVRRYERDPEWSIAGIAEWAGVSRWEMMDILTNRGITLRLGPATVEEARKEAAVLGLSRSLIGKNFHE
jgi:predicted HTH domain antitoxin